MLTVSAVGFLLTAVIHKNTSPIIADRWSRNTGSLRRVSVHLISYEARKLFLMNGAAWVLVGLMAVQTVAYLNFPDFQNQSSAGKRRSIPKSEGSV